MHPLLPCQSLQTRKRLLYGFVSLCAVAVLNGSVISWLGNAETIFSHDKIDSFQTSKKDRSANCTNCTVDLSVISNPEPNGSNKTGGLPMILHFVYKDTNILDAYRTSMESCVRINYNWKVMLWTDDSVRSFISREYPQYKTVFYGFPQKIQRADAIRYLILYRFGGVYMDLNMRCRQPLLPSLSRFPCFLDREREHQTRIEHGFQFSAMNSAMGCKPGHPFFKTVLDFVLHPDRLKGKFEFPYTIFYTTGPFALTKIYSEWVASKSMPAVQLLSESYFSPKLSPPVYDHCRQVVRSLDKRSGKFSMREKACLELQALGFERSDALFITNLTVAIHEFTHLGYHDQRLDTFDALKFFPSLVIYPKIATL